MLGIALITVVVGVVQDWSCSIVTPAQMLTSSLPLRASWIPGADKTALATCGLVLFPHQYNNKSVVSHRAIDAHSKQKKKSIQARLTFARIPEKDNIRLGHTLDISCGAVQDSDLAAQGLPQLRCRLLMVDTGDESRRAEHIILGAALIHGGAVTGGGDAGHRRRGLWRVQAGDRVEGAADNGNAHGAASEDTDRWLVEGHGCECRRVVQREGGIE